MARQGAWSPRFVGNYQFLDGSPVRPRPTRTLQELMSAAGVTPVRSSSSGFDSSLLSMLLAQADTRTDSEKKLDEETSTAASIGRNIAEVGGSVLSGLADVIDKPRSYVAAKASEIGSNLQEGEFLDALIAARNPLYGSDKEGKQANKDFQNNVGAGEYFERTLKNNDLKGTPLDNKWVKRAVGLVGDVGLDPLTYLTFGTGAVGKSGATTAVRSLAPRLAADLGEAELEQAAKRAPGVLRRLVEEGKVAAGAAEDDVAKAISKMSAEELRTQVGEGLASEAAAAYRKSGNVGLRKWAEDTAVSVGRDKAAGRALFKSLPDEVRGGIRIGNPLTNKTWGRLTEGGGLTASRLGKVGEAASGAFEGVARARSIVGGTKVGRAFSLGRNRALKMAAKTAAGAGAEEGAGILAERALREFDLAAKEASKMTRPWARQAAEAASWAASTAGRYGKDPRAFETARRIAYRNAGSVDVARQELEKAGITGKMADDAIEFSDRATRLASQSYKKGQDEYGDLFTESGYIEGPRRVVSDEGRQYLEERGVTTAAQFDNQFAERRGWKVYDEAGDFKGWQDIDAINASMRDELGGADFFETDPLKVLTKTLPRVQRRVERAALTRRLLKSGLITTGKAVEDTLDPDTTLSVARRLVGEADNKVGELSTAIEQMRDPEGVMTLFPVAPTAKEQALQTEMAVTIRRRDGLSKLVSEVADLQGPEQEDAIRRLFNVTASLQKADLERLTQQFGPTDERVKALKQELDRYLNPKSDSLEAKIPGQRRLGTSELMGTKGGRLDRTLQDKFADPLIAEALSKAVAIKEPKGISKFLETHDVALSIWRRFATLGRGPQFIARNLSGGAWNAWVAGASARHLTAGAVYTAGLRTAYNDVRRQLASGDLPLEGIDRLVEGAIERALEGKTFKGKPLIDLHRAMEEEGTLGGLTASLREADLSTYEPENLFRARTNFFSTPIDEMKSPIARAGATAVNYVGGNNAPLRKLAQWNERAETFLRAGTFFAGVEKYGDDAAGLALADGLVKASQFDYSDLSDFERNWLSRVFPFFVWTKNNLPYQVRAAINQPGKVNLALRSYGNLQESMAAEDGQDEFLPSYVRKALGFTSGIKVGDGNVVLGMNLPLTDLNMLDPRNLLGDVESNTLASTSPFIKAAIEGVTRTNTYTGQRYSDTEVGGLYRTLNAVPGLGAFIPNTYRDPETGVVMGSGQVQSILRNLLPPAAAAERLIPAGQTTQSESRLANNWWNATVGGLAPVMPQAVVTPESLDRAKRNRAFEMEDANNKAAAQAGVDIDWVRQMLRDGYTPEQVKAMIEAGQGGFGASDQLSVQKSIESAMKGNVTSSELIRILERRRAAEEAQRIREENYRR